MSRKGISILGSTGSIGTQTADVIRHLPDRFRVVALAARNPTEVFVGQVREFTPDLVVANTTDPIEGITPLPTAEGLIEAATHPDVDIVVAATSGHDAMPAIFAAIRAGKTIALANKEPVVCAGPLLMADAKEHGASIHPMDSEHSAIWQCLNGHPTSEVSRLLLSATGGPFRETPIAELYEVTVESAMNHPVWKMGGKITIDSATLMNKGLELIEAKWLFDVEFGQIEVLVHPQSIIHSMVEFQDTSVIAQLGHPDMRLPIQYALTYPDHVAGPSEPVDFTTLANLTFEAPDLDRFPALRLAREAGEAGGTYPTVMSTVDEVAVDAFRAGQLSFLGITECIDEVMQRHQREELSSLEVVFEADAWAHVEAERVISRMSER